MSSHAIAECLNWGQKNQRIKKFCACVSTSRYRQWRFITGCSHMHSIRTKNTTVFLLYHYCALSVKNSPQQQQTVIYLLLCFTGIHIWDILPCSSCSCFVLFKYSSGPTFFFKLLNLLSINNVSYTKSEAHKSSSDGVCMLLQKEGQKRAF